jgi:FkbM family methyltransferase
MSPIRARKSEVAAWIAKGARTLLKYPRSRIQRWKSASREAAFDTLADMLVNDPVLRVDEFEGSFRIGARSDLFRRLIEHRQYEPHLARLAVHYAGSGRDFVDIGANVGFYSVLLARHLAGGRGYAIEPTAQAFERLQDNIVLNNVQDRVTPIKAAIADRPGNLIINVVHGKEEYSSLGAMNHPGIASLPFAKETVPAFTLDQIVKERGIRPGFVKIDVEGCEHLVLAGARETLLTQRPVILTELWDPMITRNGSSSREVISTLRELGYRVQDPVSGEELDDTGSTVEILCLPI